MASSYEELMAKARELDANGDLAGAKRLATIALSRRGQAPQVGPVAQGGHTSMAEQSMNGVNEGLAVLAGIPVDLATMGLNLGISGINKIAGSEISPIQNPVGGSGTFNNLLRKTNSISDAEPQTTPQRYARRIGQEAGAMAIPAGATARFAKTGIAKLLGAEGASALGSGIAGQTSREIMPENDFADFAASLLGGVTPLGASRILTPRPKAPTLESLKAQQASAYDKVEQAQAMITPESLQTLKDGVSRRAASDGMDPFLAPKAARVSDKIGSLDDAGIVQVEKMRRLVGRDVAGALDPTEKAIGMGMKDEITSYLDSLKAQDVVGQAPESAIASLREGRDLTRRIKKSEDISGETGAVTKALRRASTSGTGGNEVNAIRQNIRSILDNPNKRRGYTKDEIAHMEGIVEGTPTTNALRLAGRLAPSSGALPVIGNIGAGMAAAGTGNAAFLAPALMGELSKYIAEKATKKQISKFDELVRNGAPLPSKSGNPNTKSILATLLAARMSMSASGQQEPR